ncbi:MAG: cache domain-containing protein [Acidobacteriota bacterium]|nr:cache domain-containing protein [Acidobacteriota bacterium]
MRRFIRRYLDLPLRRKLNLSFLSAAVIGSIIFFVIGTRLVHRTVFSLAQAKVGHDLSAAWMVYNDRLKGLLDTVRLSAAMECVQNALQAGDRPAVVEKLEGIRLEYDMDVFTVTDASGRTVLRTHRPDVFGDDLSGNPILAAALSGRAAAGTRIVSHEELLLDGEELAGRAFFTIVPTPMAVERIEDYEDRGMMMEAAAPVFSERGEFLGALRGGIVLNRNYEIVDLVKDVVFKGERHQDKDIGTATIFQNDLRIATNVLDDQGNRAVGTRVSRDVHQAVLKEGRAWMGRAFVVRDWSITAYEPIRSFEGNIVGMLYVGMLEKPYIDLRNRVMGAFVFLGGLGTVFLLALFSIIARSMTRPMRDLVDATERIARGDLDHRLRVERRDEVGQLAAAFNRMTDDLKSARESRIEWGRTLEKRVEERTQELRDMQDALVQSEKLASLGKMAAGVAHEINNPLTSILIQTHLLLEKCDSGGEARSSLNLIAEEAERCTQIVRGLLEFSRKMPARTAPEDVNGLVERTLQLLTNQIAVRSIALIKSLDPALPSVELDRNKMQQVFSNLVINACEAMPSGGTLTVSTRPGADGDGIEVSFADTGGGIPAENLKKIFDPFFTTKNFGTGLGLAVSYGIVRQSGGTIQVRSEPGRGSEFIVRIPLEFRAETSEAEEVSP